MSVTESDEINASHFFLNNSNTSIKTVLLIHYKLHRMHKIQKCLRAIILKKGYNQQKKQNSKSTTVISIRTPNSQGHIKKLNKKECNVNTGAKCRYKYKFQTALKPKESQ